MTAALRQIITDLRLGADMTPEGAQSIQWRERIRKMTMPSVTTGGHGLFLLAGAAKTLLLQRGQLRAHSDTALCGVLIELSNIVQIELDASEALQNRQTQRRAVPHYQRD